MFEKQNRKSDHKSQRRQRRSGHFVNSMLAFERLEDRRLLATLAFSEFVDPNPNPGNRFGEAIVPLETGNVVISAPGDDAGGTDAGAIYVFNGTSGELISTLTGSSSTDRIGSRGIRVLAGGNFIIQSPDWDNGAATDAGAVTFGNGITGVSGTITASNSLIGSSLDDRVGHDPVTILQNGNYLVSSPAWDNGDVLNTGAVTFGNRFSGVTGIIGPANSLVGSSAGEVIGSLSSSSVIELNDSNYLVKSPRWANSAGAVSFGNGTTGVAGTVGPANSLVGSSPNDSGAVFGNDLYVTVLDNGNYLVVNQDWDNGSATNAGAVTFGDANAGGAVGVISAANSLIGSSMNDLVGDRITFLENGNYVVQSPNWNDGAVVGVGAVTFGSGTVGVKGQITATNSLIGSSEYDEVGGGVNGGYVRPLSDGDYVVVTPSWDSNLASNVGAVTFGDASLGGAVGIITAANSLIGSSENDQVGTTVTELTNGNYVVTSRSWNNGSAADAGAVTFLDGASGIVGVVSEANSLVGSSANDQVGNAGVQTLPNGNYVVTSTFWDNGLATDAGAFSFGDGNVGAIGPISSANSLVGSSSGDAVWDNSGSIGRSYVQVLDGGNYVVISPGWANGATTHAGAITFGDQNTGIAGAISETNSLVGSAAYDLIGIGGVSLLEGGNYLVRSPDWDNGSVADAGAVTFGDEDVGVTGVVSASNSLVGSSADDQIGLRDLSSLGGGNYFLRSDRWDNGSATDAGAVTFIDGQLGVTGVVSASNSLVGSTSNDEVGRFHPIVLPGGNYLITTSSWDNGSAADVGAVTFGNGNTGISGVISAANSLVGSSAEDGVSRVRILDNGNYVVTASGWDNGSAINAGAATFGDGALGVTGTISASNSLVGVHANSRVGASVTPLDGGNYVVTSGDRESTPGIGVTSITFGDGSDGVVGEVTSANSLLSMSAIELRKRIFIQELAGGNYVVRDPYWDNGDAKNAGAVTFGDASSGGAVGIVSASNSLVGSASNDSVGMDRVIAFENGNYVVVSQDWDNGALIDAGAATFGDASNGGAVGEINPANSVFGATAPPHANTFIGVGTSGIQTFLVNFTHDMSGRVRVGSQSTGFAAASSFAPPTILSTRIDQGGVSSRPDSWRTVKVAFDQDVSITINALTLFNDTLGGTAADLSGMTFNYDSTTYTATWTFDPNNPLPAAFYTYTLDASSISTSGGQLDANGDGTGNDDYVTEHYLALPGDANLDGTVDVLNDAALLVENLSRETFVSWSQADFNNDGRVDVLGDAAILVNNLGQSVTATLASSAAIRTAGLGLMPDSQSKLTREGRLSDGLLTAPITRPATLSLAGAAELDRTFAETFTS